MWLSAAWPGRSAEPSPPPLERERTRGEVEVALGFFGVVAADTVVAQQVHRALSQGGISGFGMTGARQGGSDGQCQLGQAGG
jgi:hypothetical protein